MVMVWSEVVQCERHRNEANEMTFLRGRKRSTEKVLQKE
jgi:hypothetical protein